MARIADLTPSLTARKVTGMANTQTKTFPLDGFADTCTGYRVPEHGADEVIDGLCMNCSRTLQIECSERDVAARSARLANQCPGGCRDHAHGSRYYVCMCCYGD